jgi:hypothetical protein
LIELNQLSGVESIKETIVDQIIQYLQTQVPLHTIISGPSNENKKQIILCLARIWNAIGAIPNNNIRVVSRTDLVGQYVGWTAKRTQEVLQNPDTNVLMIDEAYSLSNGNNDQFGQEALDVIDRYMSQHETPTIVTVGELNGPFTRRRFLWRINDSNN